MAAWLVRRVAASGAIVFAVVTFTFLLLHLAPGEPFLPGADTPIDPAVVTQLRRQFGLDAPLPVQYAKYLVALAHGRLGESFALHRPVADALADAIPNTLALAGAALALDLLLGLALGVYQAAHARRLPDGGLGSLGCVGAAGTARYQRAAVLEVVSQDYVRTARAKGLPERRVLLVHTLRNALLPLVTLFGLSFPFLLTGAVLVESVFAWPGMGKLAADAIFRRDYPIVLAAAIAASVMVVLGSLLADVLYAVADPRIRVHGE